MLWVDKRLNFIKKIRERGNVTLRQENDILSSLTAAAVFVGEDEKYLLRVIIITASQQSTFVTPELRIRQFRRY